MLATFRRVLARRLPANVKGVLLKTLRYLKPTAEFKEQARAIYEERMGQVRVEENDYYKLVRYERDGQFDYSLYKEIQTLTNRAKLDFVFASRENIGALVQYLKTQIPDIRFVICHGTRNGAELRYFSDALPDSVRILGTDISDTAAQFPQTIQWDFHETKPEWLGACDIIHSNSWDHGFDPEKMFRSWLSCLAPSGVLALEWTTSHAPARGADFGEQHGVTDPLGMELEGLVAFLSRLGEPGRYEVEVLTDLPDRTGGRSFVLVHRRV